jgi:hypothetical protein
MKKKFLPVVTRYTNIQDNIKIIQENFDLFKKSAETKNKIIVINEGPKINIIE